MLKFKEFGQESTACDHVYRTDGEVDYRVEEIVAILDGKIVNAIENPKMDCLYFVVDVVFTGQHAHYILVNRDCDLWHEAVMSFDHPKRLLLKDDDQLYFDHEDQNIIRSAIEAYCSHGEK